MNLRDRPFNVMYFFSRHICSRIEKLDLGSRKAGVLSGECDEPRVAKVELKVRARK